MIKIKPMSVPICQETLHKGILTFEEAEEHIAKNTSIVLNSSVELGIYFFSDVRHFCNVFEEHKYFRTTTPHFPVMMATLGSLDKTKTIRTIGEYCQHYEQIHFRKKQRLITTKEDLIIFLATIKDPSAVKSKTKEIT